MKGLYIHIPFCEYICHYCDFVKQVPKNDLMIDKYLDHLIKEINSYQSHFNEIDTIYIGGGTPSMLKPYQLEKLLASIQNIPAFEKTIEVNPESYSFEKGLIFKKYGINRVSLGVQSFNNNILKYINRNHTEDEVFYAINNLKSLGLNNISVDLIYAIPGQTIEMLEYDLEMINKLNINHVSCYSLILENKTYFYHQYLKGNYEPVDNELEAQMFDIVMNKLKQNGFEHYEISNFAKNKQYSFHNMLYWTLNEYIGCGLGAHGYINNYRTYNNKSLNKYYENPLNIKVEQTKLDNLQDELIFGLRLLKGVNIKKIEEKYSLDFLNKYPEILEKIELGLVELNNDILKLTPKGIFLGNLVFEVFI